ncbi:ABC transporter ATP-binding protein [Salinibacterium sp. M195]|uniref:ABC transporter ATP-binding protein n=1 Tax=Salinibacterium sp. M195 TaxID=2583374 RepID=UPI001C62EBBC|nr:ABC transporter ATP-binding protein [Salinibacterium sp. M195]QYH35559.1 ABC transporter ATP-binding protein [Salinibacterium sp. M195]
MKPILEIDALRVSLPNVEGFADVVKSATLTVNEGEIVGLAGESGSGKTMTSSAILGILPKGARTSGTITFEGTDLLGLSSSELSRIRGNRISMIFQDPSAALHPLLTIGTQITEHMRHHLKISKREATERAVKLLDQVQIAEPRKALRSYPHQFSGGMRQRAAIAIALACEPRMLIADEPTTALDVTVQDGILQLFNRLCDETGVAVLFITHDLGVLSTIADRTYVFRDGAVVESGDTDDVLLRPTHEYTQALIASRAQSLAQERVGADGQEGEQK